MDLIMWLVCVLSLVFVIVYTGRKMREIEAKKRKTFLDVDLFFLTGTMEDSEPFDPSIMADLNAPPGMVERR